VVNSKFLQERNELADW